MELERLQMLYTTNRASQEKYAYYMLAIAAAAIAFVIQLTYNQKLYISQISLGLAVTCWAYSFYCWIRHIERAEMAMLINSVELRYIERVELKEIEFPQETLNQQRKSFAAYSAAAAKCRKRQARFLLLGGASFFLFHIIHMASTTVS